MTRLTYIESNNILQNKYPILCNNKMINVEIDLNKLTYRVYDMEGTIVQDQGKNSSDVKKRLKNYLIQSGVVFRSEIRNKGKTKKL